VVNIRIWEMEDDAKQMETLAAMLAQRPILSKPPVCNSRKSPTTRRSGKSKAGLSDRFHRAQGQAKQFAGAEYISHRSSDARTPISRPIQQTVHDPCKKPVWPVRMCALAGSIELLHITP
jgi:hypothetical protein